jgi:hypothetical protein
MANITTNQISGSIGGIAGLSMAALLLAIPANAPSEEERPTARSATVRIASPTGSANVNGFDLFSPDVPSACSLPASGTTSALADLIMVERSVATIDRESISIADAAASDAITFVQRVQLDGLPEATFSDDGILGLQWQSSDYGAALIFAGDGVVSIAFRRPGQFYAENGIEISVSDELPIEFTEALSNILS